MRQRLGFLFTMGKLNISFLKRIKLSPLFIVFSSSTPNEPRLPDDISCKTSTENRPPSWSPENSSLSLSVIISLRSKLGGENCCAYGPIFLSFYLKNHAAFTLFHLASSPASCKPSTNDGNIRMSICTLIVWLSISRSLLSGCLLNILGSGEPKRQKNWVIGVKETSSPNKCSNTRI